MDATTYVVVNWRVLLTHQGKYQARAVGDVIVADAVGYRQHAVWLARTRGRS